MATDPTAHTVALGDSIVGTTLDGLYTVGEQITKGGMGIVYHGTHRNLGIRLAIKVMRGEAERVDGMIERFAREARAAAKIPDPRIIKIMDRGITPDGRLYLVMEYIDGTVLSDVIRRGELSIARCVGIARSICGALASAHAAGIVHRDLKPDNLMILTLPDAPDFVKVLDFGIAKDTEEAPGTTRTSAVLGTPEYMSPEQCVSTKSAGPQSDIYSFGCILYEMLTGQLVFDFKSLPELMHAHTQTAPVPPSQRAPDRGITPSLDAIILRMLAKKPEDRYQSMVEVIDALRGVELPIELTPVRSPLAGNSGASPDTFTLDVSVEGPRAPSRIELAPRRTTGGKRHPTTGGGRRKTPSSPSRHTPTRNSRPKQDDELVVWARKLKTPTIWLVVIWATWHFGAKYWDTISKPLAPLIGAAKSKING